MTERYEAIIRAASAPLESIATDARSNLPHLDQVRAVMFDIYGTLLVSASGDIGAKDSAVQAKAIVEALKSIGLAYTGDPAQGAALLRTEIFSCHEQRKAAGVEYPEIEIDAIWASLCNVLHKNGKLPRIPSAADCKRLAIEFEVRVNPVWPMPNMALCLEELRRSGVVMGIISNAQFFTPLVFPAIVGRSLDQLGFHQELRYYSYEHGCAKPGRELYDMAVHGLATMEIEPQQVLYVGNDMRNDVWPAGEVGFHTALFAGDRRSLRMRSDDANQDRYGAPDAVVTDLIQIPSMLDKSKTN